MALRALHDLRRTAVIVALIAGCSPAGDQPDAPAAPADGGAAIPDASGGPALGTVTPTAEACTTQNALPSCVVVDVSCAGLPDRRVELNIHDPQPGVTPRGTIVMGSGGNGTGFYLNPEYGQETADALTAAGYRLIDRSWDGPEGWYGDTDAGLRASSCRYATLLTWVKETYLLGPAYCATGNSGGSAEIGYALTNWQRSEILDLAVPTGGPAVTRLDLICLGQDDQDWLAACDAFIDDSQWSCAPTCTVAPDHEVCTIIQDPSAESLRADSVFFEGAPLDYGAMRLHFLYGTADCGPNVPSSMNWATAVTSDVEIEIVDGMPHPTMTTPIGRDAMVRVLTEECVPR